MPAMAWAGCSRPINAAISPTGLTIIVQDNVISGFYPTLLRTLGEQAGCEFVFTSVPRARLEAMFGAGQSDLMFPASRTPYRDGHGQFIAFYASRAAILSVNHTRAPVASLKELRERRELRVALVRGFDYGVQYLAMVKDLAAQGRIVYGSDVVAVARLMQAGIADVSVITPAALGGAILSDKRIESMFDKLRIELVDDLPWGETGIYISTVSLSEKDRATLDQVINAAVKSGAVFEGIRKQYPPALIEGTLREK